MYNEDDIYGGDATGHNKWVQLNQQHPIMSSTFAAIGIILIVLLLVWLAVILLSQYFGWGKWGNDSFVGSYMRWRPNVQDKSEINAVINANAVSPPIPLPGGLLKGPESEALLESNLGAF